MAQLLDLPNEILVLIVECISQQRDHNSLVQASKRLYRALHIGLCRRNVRSYRSTALSWAAHTGQTRLLEKLVEAGVHLSSFEPLRPESMSDAALEKVENPLLYAAQAGHSGTFLAILSKVPRSTLLLRSCFHWAIRNGQTELVDLMLEHNAPLERREADKRKDSSSALGVAAVACHVGMVTRLLRAGAQVDPRDDPCPFTKVVADNTLILHLLLKSGARPLHDSALRLAAMRNNNAAVRLLIEYGFNVSMYGHFALFSAIMDGHCEVVETLIDAGANPHLASGYYNLGPWTGLYSAIWYAVHFRRLDTLRCLLARGVRPEQMDLDHAIETRFQDAIDCLSGFSYEDVPEKQMLENYILDLEYEASDNDPEFRPLFWMPMLTHSGGDCE